MARRKSCIDRAFGARPSAPRYMPGMVTSSHGTPLALSLSAYSTSSSWNRSSSPTPTHAGGSPVRSGRRAGAAYSGASDSFGAGRPHHGDAVRIDAVVERGGEWMTTPRSRASRPVPNASICGERLMTVTPRPPHWCAIWTPPGKSAVFSVCRESRGLPFVGSEAGRAHWPARPASTGNAEPPMRLPQNGNRRKLPHVGSLI
jgi:hypothetical protein